MKHQRGEHSALRLPGTHEMTMNVHPYTNTMFDKVKINIKYISHQKYPSPAMMADYENDADVFDATFYTNHRPQVRCAVHRTMCMGSHVHHCIA